MANKQTYQFGNSLLTIEFGNITTSNAQVLVSSDDYFLSMSGGISKNILQAGGQAIAMDAAKKVPAQLGDVVVTSAGSLPAQYIFHAITIGPYSSKRIPKEVIKQTTARCMEILDALHLNSIAFPAIGAGAAGFSYDEVAVIMSEVISQNLLTHERPTDVTLYLFTRPGMGEMDFLRFFVEFAKRVPEINHHEVVEQAEIQPILRQPVIETEETEEQDKKQRLNSLRKLIGTLEDKRFELEARLIEILNSGNEDEKKKIRQWLDENQEYRLKLLNELQNIGKKEVPEVFTAPDAQKGTAEKIEKQPLETYVNFDLHIATNGRIIAKSPEGEAAAEIKMDLPVDVQFTLGLIKTGEQTNASMLRNFGQSLYSWLLPPAIHTHLQQTDAVARREKNKLRLRLQIEPGTIARLPLEFLYRAIGGYYLAINPDTVLARYLDLPLPPERTRRRTGALHMLVILSGPSDLGKFDRAEWEAMFRESLSSQIETGALTMDVVKHATRKQIRNALLRQAPDIIQFVGHGENMDGKGQVALVNAETGTSQMVDEENFANLFMGSDDHLGLVSLTACESAESGDPQAFFGVAPQLVERGVPAVIAMQYAVKIRSARVFFEDFYTSLAAHKPVDWSVQYARNAVSQEFGMDNREFATPVLYMRASDGYVF